MKRFLPVFVLVAACMGLLAAPAFAAYPETGVPHTAYVHLWWGSEPIIWEECDGTAPTATWYSWSASKPGAPAWFPYKPIPAGYDIVFAAWMLGIPRGQMAAMPGNLLLEGTLGNPKDPAGDPLWSITNLAAKPYWGEVIGPDGWAMPTANKELTQMWVIAWTYDFGHLTRGTYSGVATYSFQHPVIDQTWWDPDMLMKTPAHILAMGTYTSPYSFVVK